MLATRTSGPHPAFYLGTVVVLLCTPSHDDPIPRVPVAPLREYGGRAIVLAVLRNATAAAADERCNDEVLYDVRRFSPGNIAQHLVKITQFMGAVFRARNNASILLENSKVEIVVDLGADNEHGVTGCWGQLLKIQWTEYESWALMLIWGSASEDPGPTVPSTDPEKYHLKRTKRIAAQDIGAPAVVDC